MKARAGMPERRIKVLSKVEGFEVEVTLNANVPRVRVSLADGTPVVETDALSIQGMERMGAVFDRAAKMAYRELETYWQRKHKELKIYHQQHPKVSGD
jgi:hypothetical protein